MLSDGVVPVSNEKYEKWRRQSINMKVAFIVLTGRCQATCFNIAYWIPASFLSPTLIAKERNMFQLARKHLAQQFLFDPASVSANSKLYACHSYGFFFLRTIFAEE